MKEFGQQTPKSATLHTKTCYVLNEECLRTFLPGPKQHMRMSLPVLLSEDFPFSDDSLSTFNAIVVGLS